MSYSVVQLAVDGSAVHLATGTAPFDSQKPRVVFIHGAQNDHRVWDEQLAWFAANAYGVLAPDLPGHGQSAGAPIASVELMGQWLGKLLATVTPVGADETKAKAETTALQGGRAEDALCAVADRDTPSFVLVGHSMGSLAALECAANYGEHIAALVLVGTALPMKVSPLLLAQALHDEAAAIAQIAQWSHAADLPDASSTDIRARSERLTAAEQLMHSQASGVLHTDLTACNNYLQGLEAAAKVTCPCLVVSGSKDQMTAPKFALRLQAALRAEQATLDGAGHAMMSEQGDALCEVIDQFLSRHALSAHLAPEK